MGRHVSNSTWCLLLTSAHSRFHPTCISFDLISVFSSSPFTSAPPKHPFRRIQFVYLWLRSKSVKKRRQCKHIALICSHKAVIKKRERTIYFVEVTARNKQKCNNYVLKIHVALWLFHPCSHRLTSFQGKHQKPHDFKVFLAKWRKNDRRVWFVWIRAGFFFSPLCTC